MMATRKSHIYDGKLQIHTFIPKHNESYLALTSKLLLVLIYQQ